MDRRMDREFQEVWSAFAAPFVEAWSRFVTGCMAVTKRVMLLAPWVSQQNERTRE